MSYSERKKEKKNLRCVVCNERAVGYNFDQISCESCKGKIDKIRKIIFFKFYFLAFFRRNALRDIVSILFFYYLFFFII